MTALSIYAEQDSRCPLQTTTDADLIRSTLASFGIAFERWSSTRKLPDDAQPADILSAYDALLEDLKRRGGYTTADVISLTPEHPHAAALRAKFLQEHVHTEDEVRYFVAGRGAFYLHLGQQVVVIVCEQGDLLRVPANTLHWFDTGPAPGLIAIRVFTDPKGWVAQYTGTQIAERFPRLEPGGLLPPE
jgi:1,2-dihydroxy-3-keto-5-methylthiopentene dioxygenase